MDTIDMMERAMQFLGSGDSDAAEKLAQGVLQEEVKNPDALYLLGVVEHQRGNQERAEQLLTDAIRHEGRAFWYYAILAEVRMARGNPDGAIEALKEAISIAPEQGQLHHAMARLLERLGRYDAAVDVWKSMTKLAPQNSTVWNNLGSVLLTARRSADAAAAYQRAVELNPNLADAHAGLAVSLADTNQPKAAFDAARRATELAPDDPYTHFTNGVILALHKQFDEAIEAFQAAIAKDPNDAAARHRLAVLLAEMGELREAMDQWRMITQITPYDPTPHQHLLRSYNYLPDVTREQVFEEHEKWGEVFTDPLLKNTLPHNNTPERNRKLRIGYLSADLRYHPVALFLRPILQNHDEDHFEPICFAGASSVDEMTRSLHDLSEGWHQMSNKTPKEVADLIRHEAIDILIDLGGHTNPDLLQVFALKPAPVQISYLGYCNTTGMAAMDYVVGDDITDPPDDTQPYVEQILRLPGPFACYGPIESAPDVSDLPAKKNGFVTIGCFHSLQKLNDQVLDLWARLLNSLDNSKLLIWRDRLTDREQKRLREQFAKRSIADDRLIMRRDVLPDDRMKLSVYHHADIAIDAFPWIGHTTCCNSLWMGVPFVTLRWPTHAGRMAATSLKHAGFEQWIADSKDDYVRIVKGLVHDVDALAELRRTIRPKMAESALCDGAQFTAEWERALRTVWHRWCDQRTRARGDEL